jgi:toxin ParE1/3/4
VIRKVRLHPRAGAEFEAAAEWYHQERSSLGFDFELELASTLILLQQVPNASMPHPRFATRSRVRRLMLKRFPYDLVFVEQEREIIVIALAHHARRPGYWRDRLRN